MNYRNCTGLKDIDISSDTLRRYYSGKVRELYRVNIGPAAEQPLLMLTTDRISIFDEVLPQAIPYKGAVLNMLSALFLKKAASIVPTWLIDCPGPQLMLGHYIRPLPVECIVRGYLAGHAWRRYQAGERTLGEQTLQEGLYQYAKLDEPVFTPTTKASIGEKDQDISEKNILSQGLLSPQQLAQIKVYVHQLYAQGAAHACRHGLRLIDAKYEFGVKDGTIYLIDELHTPDAARYCLGKELDAYYEAHKQGNTEMAKALPLQQLSKEALRQQFLEQFVSAAPEPSRQELAKEEDVSAKKQPSTPPTYLSHQHIKQLSKLYTTIYTQLTDTPFAPQGYSTARATLQEQAHTAILKIK